MIITSDYGSFPHSLLSTSKINIAENDHSLSWVDQKSSWAIYAIARPGKLLV